MEQFKSPTRTRLWAEIRGTSRAFQVQPRSCSRQFPHLSCSGSILSQGGVRCPLLLKKVFQASLLAINAPQRLKPLRHAKKNEIGDRKTQQKTSAESITSSILQGTCCLPPPAALLHISSLFRRVPCALFPSPPSFTVLRPPPNNATRTILDRLTRAAGAPAWCDASCRWKRVAVQIPARPGAFPSKGPTRRPGVRYSQNVRHTRVRKMTTLT